MSPDCRINSLVNRCRADAALYCRSVICGALLCMAAGAACQGRHNAARVQATDDAASNEMADSAPAVGAPSKSKGRLGRKDKPLQLIYKQASEQARQRLTAENAHLRLDELDAQIEHEKENNE